MKFLKVIFSIVSIFILTSCLSDSDDGLEQYYDNRDAGIAFLEANIINDDVMKTASGLQYEVLEPGNGDAVSELDFVKFKFTVTSIDGTVFFTNEDMSIEDIRYSQSYFYAEEFIHEGLQLMNVGSKYKIYSPYQLAYGQSEFGDILPFSALICELELLENFFQDNESKNGVEVTSSGLQYEIIEEGSGDNALENSNVKVHYHGTLLNGEVFDSSVDRGEPNEFNASAVIKGWTEGLQLMNTGAKYKFYIPYDLGYGAQGTTSIPAYATLVFDVELLEILD